MNSGVRFRCVACGAEGEGVGRGPSAGSVALDGVRVRGVDFGVSAFGGVHLPAPAPGFAPPRRAPAPFPSAAPPSPRELLDARTLARRDPGRGGATVFRGQGYTGVVAFQCRLAVRRRS